MAVISTAMTKGPNTINAVIIKISRMEIKEKIKAWIKVQKFPRHSSDVFSFILGAVLAWYHTGSFHWGIFWAGLAAVFCMANGIYLTNECQDVESDRANNNRIGGTDINMDMTSTGGTRVLVNGQLSKKAVFIVGIIFFLICAPLGLLIYFGFHSGPWTIPLGIFGLIMCYGYSNPPFKASYHGMGELFMMLGYTALVFTAYYIMAGPSWYPILICLPRIITVGSLKVIRNIPDMDADKSVGKNTLVVYIGKEKAATLYCVMTVLAILAFIPAIIDTRSIFMLLNIPSAIYLALSLKEMLGNKWKERKHLGLACKYGFKGLLLLPILLTATYMLADLFGI